MSDLDEQAIQAAAARVRQIENRATLLREIEDRPEYLAREAIGVYLAAQEPSTREFELQRECKSLGRRLRDAEGQATLFRGAVERARLESQLVLREVLRILDESGKRYQIREIVEAAVARGPASPEYAQETEARMRSLYVRHRERIGVEASLLDFKAGYYSALAAEKVSAPAEPTEARAVLTELVRWIDTDLDLSDDWSVDNADLDERIACTRSKECWERGRAVIEKARAALAGSPVAAQRDESREAIEAARRVVAFFDGEPGRWTFDGKRLRCDAIEPHGPQDGAVEALLSLVDHLNHSPAPVPAAEATREKSVESLAVAIEGQMPGASPEQAENLRAVIRAVAAEAAEGDS